MTQAFPRARLGRSPEHRGAGLELSLFLTLATPKGRFCPISDLQQRRLSSSVSLTAKKVVARTMDHMCKGLGVLRSM